MFRCWEVSSLNNKRLSSILANSNTVRKVNFKASKIKYMIENGLKVGCVIREKLILQIDNSKVYKANNIQ